MSYSPLFGKLYKEEVVPALMEQFQYSSIMEVPRLQKICLNQGVGAATQDKKLVDNALSEMTLIMENKAVLEREESLESFKAKSNLNSPSTSKDQKNRVSHSKLDQIVNKFKNLRKKRPRNSEKPGKLNIKNKRQTSNNNINININISSEQLKGLTETQTVKTPTKSRKLSSLQNNPSSTRFYTSEKISKLFYKDKVSSEHHSNKDSVRSSHKNYPSDD